MKAWKGKGKADTSDSSPRPASANQAAASVIKSIARGHQCARNAGCQALIRVHAVTEWTADTDHPFDDSWAQRHGVEDHENFVVAESSLQSLI